MLLCQLLNLLLLPLSEAVHLIGLLRSEQSSSFINVDVALTLSLNVGVFQSDVHLPFSLSEIDQTFYFLLYLGELIL